MVKQKAKVVVVSRPASLMRRLAILLPQGSYPAGEQRCAPG